MKIGILTFHRAYNCGARLQAWALQTVLERMGHTVEFPDCNEVGVVRRFIPFERKSNFLRQLVSIGYRAIINVSSLGYCDIIRRQYKKFQKRLKCIDITPKDFHKRYDLIIVGSDQVWNELVSSPNSGLFLGQGLSENIPLIAYAASFGDTHLSNEYLNQLQEGLKRFKSISVREPSGIERLKMLGFSNAVNVLDPTLLLSSYDYDVIKQKISIKKDILFTYAVSYSNASISRIREVAKILGVSCHISRAFEISLVTKSRSFSYPVSPLHLLSYTAHARYVIPASFHGMVFAILYKKPFVCIRPQKDKNDSRPASLLKLLGMTNRIVTPETSVDDIVSILREPYPNDIDSKIKILRNQSKNWIGNAIKSVL